MHQADAKAFSAERIRQLVSGIPFFNEVRHRDLAQFEALLGQCELWVAGPGDTVIQRGQDEPFLYFLLRGQLVVTGHSGVTAEVLNYISPGEVFGALAMLRGTPRSATVRVDDSTREAVLARLDYAPFQDLQQRGRFDLQTRLAFYSMLVHNIRWTLEVYRMSDPQHEVAAAMRKLPLYSGPRGTEQELLALHEQAHALADLLCQWHQVPLRATPQHI